ncbi:MAG: extensin family protein [Hyphomicrobiaceae bacterium]
MIRSRALSALALAVQFSLGLSQAHAKDAGAQARPGANWAAKVKEAPEPAVTNGYSKDLIRQGRAYCARVFATYRIEGKILDPIHQGQCGAPVPVEVTQIGIGPGVRLSQPSTFNCRMLEELAKWFKADVQPRARSLLGGPVDAIHVMSSYSCRRAYGRKRGRLSEHASANAIDIGSFSTTNGVTASLLGDWGPTEREQRAQIAAAKAAAQKRAKALAERKARDARQAARSANASKQTAEVAVTGRADGPVLPSRPSWIAVDQKGLQPGTSEVAGGQSVSEPAPPTTKATKAVSAFRGFMGDALRQFVPGANEAESSGGTTYSFGEPSRLGGPKADSRRRAGRPKGPKAGSEEARRRFLHELHTVACKRFGTVLGPEANAAHKNHFHLDMARRSHGNFCE